VRPAASGRSPSWRRRSESVSCGGRDCENGGAAVFGTVCVPESAVAGRETAAAAVKVTGAGAETGSVYEERASVDDGVECGTGAVQASVETVCGGKESGGGAVDWPDALRAASPPGPRSPPARQSALRPCASLRSPPPRACQTRCKQILCSARAGFFHYQIRYP